VALADLKLPKITYIKAANYTEGRTEPVRAIVNHRMVGYLAGTDSYFQHPDRPVSTHFGIGYGSDGIVHIHQYVPLDDTAFGNGNYDKSGTWDDWGYKTTEVNAQTISIEHQDHGDPAGKGVVSKKTQEASKKLQALLLRGTVAEWKAAGIIIRDWTHNAPILYKEIHSIPIDGRHVITHHDIAGNLKPTCWLPWEADATGFPRKTYVDQIGFFANLLRNGPVVVTPPPPVVTPPPPPPVEPPPPVTYTQAQVDDITATAVSAALAVQAGELALAQNTAQTMTAAVDALRALMTTSATDLRIITDRLGQA
jgi:N-acetyl-anhydromuramyl-L-alanine amidase AmpD